MHKDDLGFDSDESQYDSDSDNNKYDEESDRREKSDGFWWFCGLHESEQDEDFENEMEMGGAEAFDLKFGSLDDPLTRHVRTFQNLKIDGGAHEIQQMFFHIENREMYDLGIMKKTI